MKSEQETPRTRYKVDRLVDLGKEIEELRAKSKQHDETLTAILKSLRFLASAVVEDREAIGIMLDQADSL